MKKVRIMLAAIVVLGAVGGALAVKAKTFGSNKYCITTDIDATICPVFLSQARFAVLGATQYAYTPTAPLATTCPETITCNAVGRYNP